MHTRARTHTHAHAAERETLVEEGQQLGATEELRVGGSFSSLRRSYRRDEGEKVRMRR